MVGAKGMCVKMVGVEPEEKQEACHHGRCIERIGSCHEGQGEPRWDFWQRITCGEIWNKQLGDWQDEPDKKQGASERGRCVRAVKELQPKGLGCCMDREVGEKGRRGWSG